MFNDDQTETMMPAQVADTAPDHPAMTDSR
jgi:hypothetical protein